MPVTCVLCLTKTKDAGQCSESGCKKYVCSPCQKTAAQELGLDILEALQEEEDVEQGQPAGDAAMELNPRVLREKEIHEAVLAKHLVAAAGGRGSLSSEDLESMDQGSDSDASSCSVGIHRRKRDRKK
jgi:hypothetical protein